jgi:hypothetical protein
VSWIETRIKNFKNSMQYGPVAAIFNLFQGRATFFAVVFTISGITLAFLGKLTADFVGLVGSIQALIFAHSIKEDYYDFRHRQLDIQRQPAVPPANLPAA